MRAAATPAASAATAATRGVGRAAATAVAAAALAALHRPQQLKQPVRRLLPARRRAGPARKRHAADHRTRRRDGGQVAQRRFGHRRAHGAVDVRHRVVPLEDHR
eukprot:2922012-Prymnesium_polylepis.2